MRRHPVIILALLVLVPVAAGVLVLGRATTYTSGTTVFLRPTIGNALSPDSAKNAQQVTVAMQTEAGLVSAPQVAALVGKRLHTTVEAGSNDVVATVPPNTQIVDIKYTAATADAARAGSEAYAAAFLDARRAVSDDTVKRQLQLLKEQANTVTANLRKVSADAASASPSPDSAALVQLYTNRLTNLQDLIGQLETTDRDPGSVITPAATPAGRAPLGSALILAAAALLGLLAGVSLAVWRERGDDRLRASEDETVGGVPLLARLPGVHAHDGPGRERQQLELADGYRHARAALLIALHGRAVVAVAAADSSPAVPAGVIAANLAACLAGGRYNVCVLDVADAASGGQSEAARVLGVTPIPVMLPAEPGHGGARLDMVPRGYGVGVVTLDRAAEDDPGLFVSSRFLELVTALQSKYDIVVVAAPPLRSAHGTEICLVADGVMLLATDRRTTREGVRELVTQQSRLRVPVLGVVSLEPAHWRGGGRAEVSYDAIGVTSAAHASAGVTRPAAEPVVAEPTDFLPAPGVATHRPPSGQRPGRDAGSAARAEARSEPGFNGRARPVPSDRTPEADRTAAAGRTARSGASELPRRSPDRDRSPERGRSPEPVQSSERSGAEPDGSERLTGVASVVSVDDETVVLRRAQVDAQVNGKSAAKRGKPDSHGTVGTRDGRTWFDRSQSDD